MNELILHYNEIFEDILVVSDFPSTTTFLTIKFIIKKFIPNIFILNILYYKFIETSRIFVSGNTSFSSFVTLVIQKCKKPSLSPVRILAFFYKTNFYSVNRGSPQGLGKPFCANSLSFFHIFSISQIFNPVTASDREKKNPQRVFSFFFLCPLLGVLLPI